MRKKNSVNPPISTAVVRVDFPRGRDSFVSILDATNSAGQSRLTPATFTLVPDPELAGVIVQDPKTGNLRVGKPVIIDFQLAVGFGFRPAGVAFRQISPPGGGVDSHGRDNLPKSSIVITDDPFKFPSVKVCNTRKTKDIAWKLYIFMQDGQGNLGVIDPAIENTDLN
jgi:hypothetical protein